MPHSITQMRHIQVLSSVICALPWFFLEKRRPGLTIPPGTSLWTIGFRQTYIAFRECMKLKQTFLYLVFYFVMGDVLNTTVYVFLIFHLQYMSYHISL